MATHRFKPRFRGVAWASIGVGGTLAVVASVAGFVMMPLITGVAGVALGAAYFASPTWKLSVTTDDDGLEVGSPTRRRFRIAWSEVKKVIASPSTNSCFVDGGEPAKSLLVPGVGAPAPYDLEDRPALLAAILAHVPAERVETVEFLDPGKQPKPASSSEP
jgi:hypothetical protein